MMWFHLYRLIKFTYNLIEILILADGIIPINREALETNRGGNKYMLCQYQHRVTFPVHAEYRTISCFLRLITKICVHPPL